MEMSEKGGDRIQTGNEVPGRGSNNHCSSIVRTNGAPDATVRGGGHSGSLPEGVGTAGQALPLPV